MSKSNTRIEIPFFIGEEHHDAIAEVLFELLEERCGLKEIEIFIKVLRITKKGNEVRREEGNSSIQCRMEETYEQLV